MLVSLKSSSIPPSDLSNNSVEVNYQIFAEFDSPVTLNQPTPTDIMSSQAEIQEKISAARREADQLKEKIRQKKDLTADTSRKS